MAEGFQGRILIVDDDPGIRAASSACLSRAGFDILEAENGAAALDIVKGDHFDVILSDITMPGVGGLDLLRAVRDHDLDVPVVLMTGGPTVETAIKAVEYGALRYLTKPVRPDALVDIVTNAVKMHRMALVKREALELLGKHKQQLGDRASLESNFNRAMESIWMAYQPIISWKDKSIYAYEALVRSTDPNLVHPGLLFDAAERLDRVKDLGFAIRSRVDRDLAEHDCDQKIFVNLHPNDLTDERLYTDDAPLLAHSSRVVLEITERASLSGMGDIKMRVTKLREKGFHVAIDDLGAGYAGLSTFALLEPDLLKIDMSLVRDIHQDPTKQRVVRSMLDLGREMNMQVIVEGIETQDECDTLIELGADLLQGFLFAKPSPPFVSVDF